jgi:formate dehydrogenase beta subunit
MILIQQLRRLQDRHGYLRKDDLLALARDTDTPLYRLQELISFFPHFRLTSPPPVEVDVCRDMTCHLRGAGDLFARLKEIEKSAAPELCVRQVSCLGRCDRAPVLRVTRHDDPDVHERLCTGIVADGRRRSVDAQTDAVSCVRAGRPAEFDRDIDGPGAPAPGCRIEVNDGSPTYPAVRKFLQMPEPAAFGNGSRTDAPEILRELDASGLVGMGGAGEPAGKKWREVWEPEVHEKYVVANGDESEPGTFKDRELLLRMPHLVIEGMILAGLFLRAERGYLYIRHEYPEQVAAARAAIADAERQGVCGENILGSGRHFFLQVFVSPGGYICGEQSALLEAMEDRRAQPRNRPPELKTNGLFDKPTLISNVESFAWVPSIVLRGGAWYRDQGVNGWGGRRFFSISGDVNRPGVYEVPIGLSLRELIEGTGYAQGIAGGRALKAVAPSGPSGGFLPPRIPLGQLSRGALTRLPEASALRRKTEGATHLDVLDLELDLILFRNLGLMLGAGIVVYAEGVDLVGQAACCSEFFSRESCGKCVPCRLGSREVADIAAGLQARGFDAAELAGKKTGLGGLRLAMEQTSICGLGTVAANPLDYLFRFFPEEVGRYLR